MKTTILSALAAIALLFSLTACGDSDKTFTPPSTAVKTVTATPTPSPTKASAVPSETETSSSAGGDDAAFLADVRENVPSLADVASSDVLDLGEAVCKDFDDGGSVDAVLLDALSIPGISAYEAGYFVGDSVGYFCPEYLPELKDYVATASPTS